MSLVTARWKQRAWVVPGISALVFLLTGLAILPYPGLQSDEVAFWQVLTREQMSCYTWKFGGFTIPVMQLSYVGALKSWLYWPIFHIFNPSVWSVRLPVLLCGVLTIWLTWCWMRRLAGVGAAIVTTILLGTDTVFLLTDTFDWGPVALQHVFLTGGLLSVQRWLQSSSRRYLALGFFLWGVGLFDKALLIWPLAGLAVGVACVFPRELFRRLRLGTAAVAIVSMLCGAAPLVVYNLSQSARTVSQNVHIQTDTIRMKAGLLYRVFDGTALMGTIAYWDREDGQERQPRNFMERTVLRIENRLPGHRKNWMPLGYILAFCCFVLLWRWRGSPPAWRVLLFLAIVMLVEWTLMALTKAAGFYSHHTILLWPFPLAFVGIAFSESAQRIRRFGWPLAAIVVGLLAVGNLLTTNRYLADFITNGPRRDWTDAVNPLVSLFQDGSVQRVAAIEWGYLWQIQMLTSQRVKRDCRDHFLEVNAPLVGTCSPLNDSGSNEIDKFIASPDAVFIQHTRGNELRPGVNERFLSAVSALGYREEIDRVIYDGHGRPIFEVFRLRR